MLNIAAITQIRSVWLFGERGKADKSYTHACGSIYGYARASAYWPNASDAPADPFWPDNLAYTHTNTNAHQSNKTHILNVCVCVCGGADAFSGFSFPSRRISRDEEG